MDWRHEAACREVDPELFFPIGNTGPALLQIDEAKQVCRRCSVMDECLRWAIESGQDAGVWGGMSEDERRALKRRTIRLRARAHVLSAQALTRIRPGGRRPPRCRHPAGARSAAVRPAR
jgi:WhiB family transcriptional regulator, redox-sensing transcriptional regulator